MTNQSSEAQGSTTTTPSPTTDPAAFQAWLERTPELDGEQTIVLPITLETEIWLHVAQIGKREEKSLGLVLSEYINFNAVLSDGSKANDPEQQPNPANMPYTEYTVRLSTEPSYYGSGCTEERAAEIVESLGNLVRVKFPGIVIVKYVDGDGGSKTMGPSDAVCDKIKLWIAANWTAAL
jgi:hypothetical protein